MPVTTTAATAAAPLVRTPMRLAVIVGSNRDGRFAPVVADWAVREARAYGAWEVDVIDVATTPLPSAIEVPGMSEAREVAELGARLAAADAFVVVTPEYNHSFPAALKHMIDLFRDEWRAKPVGFVSYGGMGGGLRAVEQLRLVFAELHAVGMRDSISFHMAWERFDEEGRPVDAEGCASAAKGMLAQLEWWSRTLLEARAARPYDV
ncbi:NADPH-dependent FMN reductase [Yinghuangia sp. YIM S09857]|uniref:NADPH-dependent FMN reductase n=1 Tax=Yinghuangia sp. YIM S09857 TaxID=3436929 RepID=UPI003F529FE6